MRLAIKRYVALAVVVALTIAAWSEAARGLGSVVEKTLRVSSYVYVTGARKDGPFGQAAPVWFLYEDGAVWVATSKLSWRAKRLAAGHDEVTISVGQRSGPTFDAIGSIVDSPQEYERLYARFAAKYPNDWEEHGARLRTGLADGSHVLIRYQPEI